MHFCENCDDGRSSIKTKKHDIFVRIVIMVAILIKIQKHDSFIRTAIIFATLIKT